MKIKLSRCIWVALVIILCFSAVNSSKRSPKSKSISSNLTSAGNDLFNSSTSKSCQKVNGVTTCSSKTYKMSKSTFLLVTGFIGSLIVIAIFSSQKEIAKRKTITEGAFNKYKEKVKLWTSTKEQKQDSIRALKNNKYQIDITVKGNEDKTPCYVQILDLKPESENIYSIKLSGKDEIGKSTYEGILAFNGSKFGVKLSKVYLNRTKAEQTGNFDVILFEGESSQKPTELLSGNWAYHGFENSDIFSGNWSLNVSSQK